MKISKERNSLFIVFENFRIVDIFFYPGKFLKFDPIRVFYAESRTANQKLGSLKCCASFNERTLTFIKKEKSRRISKKSKGFRVDIEIKLIKFEKCNKVMT